MRHRSMIRELVVICLLAISVPSIAAEPKRGFTQSGKAQVTVAETVAHPELWAMDIQFKPLRMVRTRNQGLIWYLVFRVVNRDLGLEESSDKAAAAKAAAKPDTVPQNVVDDAPRKLFSPRFTLVTNDGDQPKTYVDFISRTVQAEVGRREGLTLKNPIELVGQIPPVTKRGAEDEEKNARYGVVMWRGVDPKTDRFSVFMTGLSNGYRLVKGPDGETLVERKTVVQKFWRPGDRYEQDEREVRFDGETKWIYRAEERPLDVKVDIPVGTPPHTVGVNGKKTPLPADKIDEAGEDAAGE